MKFFYLFILLSLVSCKDSATMSVEEVSYKKKSTIVLENGLTTEAHFLIPNCQGNTLLTNRINNFFLYKTAEIIGFDANKEKVSYQYLMDAFVFDYEKMKKMLPLDNTPWEAKLSGNINEFNQIYNPYISYYVFSGGTSLEEGIKSTFFSKKTETEIQIKDLFLNFKSFEKFAEKSFIEQFGSYKTNEFYFENEEFKLAENHYIKDNNWVISYATGEIAPMYKGVFEVKIPLDSLKPMLNPIYFK